MKDQRVSTKIGAIILVIIAATVGGFVLFCFKNYPVKYDVTQVVYSQKSQESTDSNPEELIEYSDMGIKIGYPNDGTYTIEAIDPNHFVITQDHPGNRFHVFKNDNQNHGSIIKNVTINGKEYKMFSDDGMGNPYGYITEHEGNTYSFESVFGPKNDIFEMIMNTVTFE